MIFIGVCIGNFPDIEHRKKAAISRDLRITSLFPENACRVRGTSESNVISPNVVHFHHDWDITGGPARKASCGEFMGRSEIIPRLTREERCIALNKFMARPRLWSTRSSWRAPRRVFRIEILLPSQLSSLFSFGWSGAMRFHASIAAGYPLNLFSFKSSSSS